MFAITADHIAQLNDTDLRTLVAHLCEAELRRAGLPVAAVTAGGHQNAPDGGLDVRVDLPPSTPIRGFIPRPATGYQVKVFDLPPQKILDEMCPGGKLRPVIQELGAAGGAYLIVSARGSAADTTLRRRRAAMREAVATLPDAAALTLDFYGGDRLAQWVNDHPGLAVWVREKVGQPIHGWRPYANWAAPSESLEAEYIYDQTTRLYDGQSQQTGSLAITEGIERIRAVLAQPRKTVRLIGLSGTGKTRLAQALFDARLGSHPLDPALAVYTDQGEEPQPTPIHLLRWLVQNQRRLIVIVDNCLPETHRLLAAICAEPSSTISLLTIEYDVGEDEPESTEVFRLDSGSPAVIEQLLERRAPHVSQLDRHRIAELSAGNARIALALAHTVQTGESIARLTDKVLFERLFYQRQTKDENLLRAAEACSLVYSFNGEQTTGDTAELPILAELADIPVNQLYRHVEELRTRELIQRRSCWRALLPQALALRLARQALERIPPAKIMDIFWQRAPGRLLKSFSRQLGHLHDCEPAQHIVQRWLAPDSKLCTPNQFKSPGLKLLLSLAP